MREQLRISSPACVAVLASAVVLRLIGLDKGLWGDEVSTLRLISPDDLTTLLAGVFTYDHPPAYSLLLKLWSLLGPGEAHLRLLSVILGLAAMGVTVMWAARTTKAAALPAAVILGAFPIFLRFSQEIRSYPLLLLATALAFLSASLLIREPQRARWYAALSAALSLAIATHTTGVFLPLAVLLWLALEHRREPSRIRRSWLIAAMAVPAGLVVALAGVLLWKGVGSWWMPPLSAPLAARTMTYLISPWWTAAGPLSWVGALPLLTIAGSSLLALGLARGDWRRSTPFLAAAVAFGLEVAVCSLLFVPVFWYRTLLPALIPLTVFVAVQLSTGRRTWARALGFSGLFLLAAIAAAHWVAVEAHRPAEGLPTAARVLDQRLRPDDLVVVFPDYVVGATSYYSTALRGHPAENLVAGSRAAALERSVRRWAESRGDDGAVVILVRVDTTAQKRIGQFAEGVLALDRSLPSPTRVELVTLLSHDARFVPSLEATRDRVVADLETAFGEPASRSRSGDVTTLSFRFR